MSKAKKQAKKKVIVKVIKKTKKKVVPKNKKRGKKMETLTTEQERLIIQNKETNRALDGVLKKRVIERRKGLSELDYKKIEERIRVILKEGGMDTQQIQHALAKLDALIWETPVVPVVNLNPV